MKKKFLDEILNSKEMRNMQIQRLLFYAKEKFNEITFENHVKVLAVLMQQSKESGKLYWDPNLFFFYLDDLTSTYYHSDMDPEMRLKLEDLINKATEEIKNFPVSVNGTLKVMEKLYRRLMVPLPAIDDYFKTVLKKDMGYRLQAQIMSHYLRCLKDDS